MSETQSRASGEEKLDLDDVILYLLTKKGREEGYKIPISDVHQVMETVEEDLKREFEFPLKFHQSSQHVHSQQVEQALGDIIPYKIPVRNPSFSLEIKPKIGNAAFDRISDKLSDNQRELLDGLFNNPEFQETLEHLSTQTKGE